MSKRIEYIIDDIKEQYLEKDNNIPWIIGLVEEKIVRLY